VQQAITPDRVLGRVNATTRFLGGGVLPVCALIGGGFGEAIGLPLTLRPGGSRRGEKSEG
jgi:hypothetical protein